MSGGLKMLSGSDMSPSKDNLIISSLEDVHITSDEVNMDISVEINGTNKLGGDNKESRHHHHNTHSKSASKDKMGSGVKEQSTPHIQTEDVVVTQQKNLINNGSLRQQQQKKMKQQQYNAFLVTQPQTLRGSGRDEKLQLDRNDDHPAAIISHEVIDGTTTGNEGPMVLEVDPAADELDRRGCCESVSRFRFFFRLDYISYAFVYILMVINIVIIHLRKKLKDWLLTRLLSEISKDGGIFGSVQVFCYLRAPFHLKPFDIFNGELG